MKSTGDGAMATFTGPARAVECARAIRDQVATLGIEIRAGIHTGEIEQRGDDISGVAVHLASRISSLAGPSDVLVGRRQNPTWGAVRIVGELRARTCTLGELAQVLAPRGWAVTARSRSCSPIRAASPA